MINRVQLIGNLGHDPSDRMTTGGNMVVSFTLATNEKWKDEKHTEWHNVVTFGKLAEICNQYLQKGSLVYIEGKLRTSEWEDKDGIKRRKTEVIANNMQMLDKKKPENDNHTEDENRIRDNDDIPDGDDIPF